MVAVPQVVRDADHSMSNANEAAEQIGSARGSNWIHSSLQIIETPDCGYGVVAREAIAAGTLVVMFGGVVTTSAEFEVLPPNLQHFPFQVADDLFLGPRDESDIGVGERINHSCDPSVGFSGAIALVALRDIKKGEPITLDYATCVASNDDAFTLRCRCGAPNCRRTITGQDWKIPQVQDRLLPYYQPFIQAKVLRAEDGRPLGGLLPLSRVSNNDRVQTTPSSLKIPSSWVGKVADFFKESLKQEWMAIPICILAGFPSTLVTTAIMSMISPGLRYFEFARSEAGFISAVALISSVVGYGTYLLAYYAGMMWKERCDWFVDGRVCRQGLRRKLKVIQYDFLAHLPSDFWVMPVMGAATGGLFAAGASQFWSIILAHTVADIAYAIKEPFFWHGAKELVAWREGRAASAPDTVGV